MEGHRGRRGDESSPVRSASNAIRVLVADDHPTIIEGLVSALGRHALSVVGHAGNIDEVIPKFAETNADVLVIDVCFGEGATGLDVARDLLTAFPKARITFEPDVKRNGIYVAVAALNAIDALDRGAAPVQDGIAALPESDPAIIAKMKEYVPRLKEAILADSN